MKLGRRLCGRRPSTVSGLRCRSAAPSLAPVHLGSQLVRGRHASTVFLTGNPRLISTGSAPLQRFARLAGALYIAMMPFGFFGIVYVPSVLLVPGDAAATLQKVMASEHLLRMGTVSHIIGQVIFLLLVLTLFRLLQAVHQPQVVLMVVVALIGVPLTLYNEVNHLTILALLDPRQSAVWPPEQLASLVTLLLTARGNGVVLSQVFWGLWLLPLGFLVIRAGFLPPLLGYLLVVAGLGYLVDVTLHLLAPSVSLRVTTFTFIGELLLPLWLLIRGVKQETAALAT